MKVIFATKNDNKLIEINHVMKDCGFSIISMKDAGIDIDVIEDGDTFEENAIKKAVEISKISGLGCMADDSGLEIDFLDKAPGVMSARYLGEDTPYEIKNRHILKLLEGVSIERRTARFICVIAFSQPDGSYITTRGVIEGIIHNQISGSNGFGYDPIFFVPEKGKTTAELSITEKNEISHRGKALRLMRDKIEKWV